MVRPPNKHRRRNTTRRRDLLSGQKRAANRLECTALNHHRRASLGLREAASYPAYGEALKAQRRVVPVYGQDGSFLGLCCSKLLPNVHLAVHRCKLLVFRRDVMVRQRMLVTARQQRLDTRRRALERAEAEVGLSAQQHAANVRAAKQALAKAEQAAPKPGDLKEVCRLCSTSVCSSAAAHRCPSYYCTNILVECTDLVERGIDLGAAGEDSAARLLQQDVPVLILMRPVGEGGSSSGGGDASSSSGGGDASSSSGGSSSRRRARSSGGVSSNGPSSPRYVVQPQGELARCFVISGPAGDLGRGLFAATSLPRGAWVAPYSGLLKTAQEAQADEDPSLALALVSSHHPQADGAVYVQPAGLGAVARLANHSCTDGNMAMEAGMFDPQRGLEVARLRASKRVRAGEQLTWHYDASTDCQAEAEAVLCQCAACGARAAKRKRRSHLFTLLPASVPRCGKCTTCLQTAA